ncbi:MAG TPA: FAD-dependent oxidoreductase [Acidobacteriota bacterium]|nr:FAD-dependent oxidoreductase [Acidobacteriota bacterium]
MNLQVIVLGNNLTGMAAAQKLAEQGVSVGVAELPEERSFPELLSIDPTPFNSTEMKGFEFWYLMDHLYQQHQISHWGGKNSSWMIEYQESRFLLKSDTSPIEYTAQTLIYCPYLCPPLAYPPPKETIERLHGYSVSWCTSSDGYFCRGKKVVVVGSGDWALEQALIVADFASEVVIVCPQPQLNLRRNTLMTRLHQKSNIRVLNKSQVTDLITQNQYPICGIRYLQENISRELSCEFLFLATEIEDGNTLIEPSSTVSAQLRELAYQAGTITGIHYAEHDLLVKDGFRVAQNILRDLHLDD